MFRTNLKESPIRAGKFLARVLSTREIKTKKGDPMVFADWLLLEGPDEGRTVSLGVAFVPQMVSRNNHILRVLEQPFGEDVEVNPDDWHERVALITVALEANGSTVTEIERVPQGQAVPAAQPVDDIPF